MLKAVKNPRALAILAILLLAVVVAPSAQSYPFGVSGVQNDGCSCHGQSASDEVVPSLEGLPDEFGSWSNLHVEHHIHGWPIWY